MPEQNPFSRGYAAILAAFKAWPALATMLVKPGNIQSLQTPGFQPRVNVQSAERPEIRVVENRINLRPLSVNSLGSLFRVGYPIQIKSGEFAIDKINLVIFEVDRALTAAGYALGQTDIIQKWEVSSDAELREMDPQSKRKEWTGIATVTIYYAIDRKYLLSTTYT